MKGIIFTEYLKMVEEVFSLKITDEMINDSQLSTGGSYTTVGTYDYHELLSMVTNLSKITGIAIPDLEIAYGKYLFNSFTKHYANFIINAKSSFELLISINDYIHVEVKKLYPDAELPVFYYELRDPTHLMLEYRSKRPFADLAQGLILGAAEHFGEQLDIKRENMTGDASEEHLNIVRFFIEKKE